jgi:hypothetical protein
METGHRPSSLPKRLDFESLMSHEIIPRSSLSYFESQLFLHQNYEVLAFVVHDSNKKLSNKEKFTINKASTANIVRENNYIKNLKSI